MPPSRAKRLAALYALCNKEDTWLVLINADPDAIASALALKRLFSRRVKEVRIMAVNRIARPDNLAMLRYLSITIEDWDENIVNEPLRFALVDSQAHHHVRFSGISFSCVIDHHPLQADNPADADYADIRPAYGATSTMLFEYMRTAKIKPSVSLATALLYGIRTDTAALTRGLGVADLRAYHALNTWADPALLLRIVRSEYLPEWLPEFAKAIKSLQLCKKGKIAYVDEVESADILVVLADFFTKVHGLRWVAVGGIADGYLIVIFRSDGLSINVGTFASEAFGEFGLAGGHEAMARAELPLENLPQKTDLQEFLKQRLLAFA